MPNFLTLIHGLSISPPKSAKPKLEPRSLRRKKGRDAAKASQPKRSRPVSNNLVNQN